MLQSLNVSKCFTYKRQFELKPCQNLSEFAMKVATLERIRREKNRDAARFRSAFFARGNQPLYFGWMTIPVNKELSNNNAKKIKISYFWIKLLLCIW
jgi:hypothetical protein